MKADASKMCGNIAVFECTYVVYDDYVVVSKDIQSSKMYRNIAVFECTCVIYDDM